MYVSLDQNLLHNQCMLEQRLILLATTDKLDVAGGIFDFLGEIWAWSAWDCYVVCLWDISYKEDNISRRARTQHQRSAERCHRE